MEFNEPIPIWIDLLIECAADAALDFACEDGSSFQYWDTDVKQSLKKQAYRNWRERLEDIAGSETKR